MGFSFRIAEVTSEAQATMRGQSWHDDPRCPPFADLRAVHITHLDFDARDQDGTLIVHRDVAEDLETVFHALYEARYPIAQMRPVCHYAGDDDRSMAANNSSAFNFRVIAGTDTLSQHALGRAIDINPVQNPWVRGDAVFPPTGVAFVDRTTQHPALLREDSVCVTAFQNRGWEWGGTWTETKDYHHFVKRT